MVCVCVIFILGRSSDAKWIWKDIKPVWVYVGQQAASFLEWEEQGGDKAGTLGWAEGVSSHCGDQQGQKLEAQLFTL